MWGGAEVRPKDPDNIVVTIWGGTLILLPTLAQKIMRLKQAKAEHGEINDSVIRRTNVITVMAGTAYRLPTIAQEIEDMKQLKDSGSIPQSELIELWREAITREDMDQFESLTLMGGAGEEAPSRKKELKDLDRIAARGVISARERDELRGLLEKNAIASGSEQRQETLRSLMEPVPAYAPAKSALPGSAILE